MRRADVLGSVGNLLLRLPLPPKLEAVGHYYQALSLNRVGLGDTLRAGKVFEEVADNASVRYRVRAMLALGSNSLLVGERKTALSFYSEVIRIASRDTTFDPVTLYIAVGKTAVIRGMDGDHQGAVADLERMFSLTRIASSLQPFAHYDYMNALAVELAELGRLEQAAHCSAIALRFPAIRAFPEWQETFAEVEGKRARASRSVVTVRQPAEKPDNLLRLPVLEPSANLGLEEVHAPGGTKARVLNFCQRKTLAKASSPLPEEYTPGHRRGMTTGQKLIRLMDLISKDETDDETIDRILEAVEQIALNSLNEKLD